MINILFAWGLLSCLGMLLLAFNNAFVKDKSLKVKHIICGILFLPITLIIGTIIGLAYLWIKIEELDLIQRIIKYISNILNKEVKFKRKDTNNLLSNSTIIKIKK